MPIELKQFQKDLNYAIQAPVANVLTDLHEIENINILAELKQREYGNKALYYFLGLITSIIFIFIVSNIINHAELRGLIVTLLYLIIFGLAIACIYALVKRSQFKLLNIRAYRNQVTKKVVQMVSRDMDKAALLDLKLSFHKIEEKENKIDTIKHPRKPGWNIDNYQYSWLKIQGQFLDNTRFELTATGLSKRQYGWKTGRSGKSKHKSKIKSVGLDVNLSLTYPQRRYGAVKILKNEASNAIKLPDLSYLRRLRITDKAMHISVRISPQIADNEEAVYQIVTAMFLSFYQVLNLAKMLSK